MNKAEREKALRDAIQRSARADASHDIARRHTIAEAKDLGMPGLLPDNWRADGTLKDTRSAWGTVEQRDTANDVFTALEGAIADAYPEPDDRYYSYYVWVQDWMGGGEDDNPYKVIFHMGGDLYAAPFEYDEDNKIVLGEAVKVRPVTEYVERGGDPAPEKRKALENTIAMRKARMPKRGEREIRTVPIQRLELREGEVFTKGTEDNEGRELLRFVGYASVFDQRYGVGLYEEVITRGAFKRSLDSPKLDCVLRMEHVDLPLARTTGIVTLADGAEQATLTLAEDSIGLRVEALLDPEDPDVQRLAPKMRRQDLNEMSFAFRCIDDAWSDDYGIRTVRVAEIHRGDVSIVTYGASPTTSSTLRSENAMAALRQAGPEGLIAALGEWRKHTPEATLTGPTMELLGSMLDLVAPGEDPASGQTLLADLMASINPADPEETERAAEAERPAVATGYARRARLRQLARGGER